MSQDSISRLAYPMTASLDKLHMGFQGRFGGAEHGRT